MAVEKATLATISSLLKLFYIYAECSPKIVKGTDNSGDLDIDGKLILRC
jgi:hypothetical protein